MLAQFAKLSVQRSVSRPNSAAIQSLRLLSTDGKVSPPTEPVHLGNLADNPGAVTEVIIIRTPVQFTEKPY